MTTNNLNDDRCYKILSRWIPDAIPTLKKLASGLEQFDPTEPQTHKAKMEQIFVEFVEKMKDRERVIVRLFRFFLRSASASIISNEELSKVSGMVKGMAKQDPRYSLLLKLLNEADKKMPFVSFIAVLKHADPRKNIFPMSSPIPSLQKAEKLKGEKRKDAVLEAFRLTVEHLYKPYVETMWALSYFKDGEIPPTVKDPSKKKPEFGVMVKTAHEKLSSYPGLVELRAGWMRNSITHDLLTYDVNSDSIELKDSSGSLTAIKVTELLELTCNLYQISAETITHVTQLYMFRDFFISKGFLSVLIKHLPGLLSTNPLQITEAEKKFDSDMQQLIAKHINPSG